MNPMKIILAFVSDLMFQVKIEQAAQGLGYRVDWIETPGALGEASLLSLVTEKQPDLVIFDLGSPSIPWREWLPELKSDPKGRGVPVICYGSHVDIGSTRAARSAGAEAVLARSRFVTALPELIQKYALK